MTKEFYIKNMVCDRCIKILKIELEEQGIAVKQIELGRAEVELESLSEIGIVKKIVENNGFELIEDAESILVEEIKIELIKLLKNLPLNYSGTLSDYLASKVNQDYSKLSKLFSYNEKITIEKYFIKLKIEKVKEMIQDGEYNFTEISQLLDYSNVGHLSAQFKNDTGMSLTNYKALKENFRNSLDQII
ncbi:MAG: AraC family transcriptional regulator [Leeuwenhoekiella sp.]